ncbi:hypothetical protein M3Y95_00850800 [Aphelenchoides besseyi]|nr:hypothetical protein M3Y95_00850800 [Aphelenchoides besseyi]
MDEQADRSSSSECDFELVRDDEDLRPKQASHDCWTIETLKTTFLQNIKSFSLSNSWLTVSLIVLLLGLTVEYKRVSNINELMSEQLKDLRRDYDQLKMHDTNQQLQILTELRALRDCGRPATIHEPKKVELKPVEVEPEAEHLKTEIKEEPKTTVKPKSMDIQETKVVGTKPIDEPNNEQLPTDEQKLINDPNNLECSRDCDDARNTRRSIQHSFSSENV